MVRGARKFIALGVAAAVVYSIKEQLNFVPGPRHAAPVAAAAAASMMMAPAAFADEIGDASKKLGDASYNFAKEVDWNNGIFLQAPGKFQPLKALKAIDKMIEMGAAADPKLLKAAAEAHHKAIGSISGPNGVTSRADWDEVNTALGRVVASVPKAKVMAVYDAVKDITDPKVPAYMKSLVNGPDAEKAYQGFLEFKDVVAKNQVTAASAPAVVPSGDKIGAAAKQLSDASYPFIKDIDWLSDIYLKPLPGKTAPETLKAIDKMIVMGAKMDGNLLKAAAEAHHKAIGSVDSKGVTSAADYEAVNAALGRLVASVPKETVMDVYNSMAKIVDPTVTNNMFSKVNPLDAVAAAKGFYTFKDVVQASQRCYTRILSLETPKQVFPPVNRCTGAGEMKFLALGVAAAVVYSIKEQLNFVPGPRHAAPVAAAAAASMMMAPAAFADEIGDASKKLGDASYNFAKEVDWNNGIFLQAPGKFQPLKALKAIDKMIEMGAAADPKLLKAAAEAHHKAIGSISGPNGVTSRADWDEVNAALGRVVASVPKAKVMAVYDAVKDITDPKVPAYMKSLVNGPDAEKAYQGFLEFKDVVAKNQVTAASAPAVVPSGDKIGAAAKQLSDASYPFIKDIDWLSDIYLKPLPGKTAPETLKAIDKMIVMGAKMDGNLLKAAAEAHHKAIGSVDSKGVTSAADYEAVNAALGRLVASVPKETVMDVYNSMAKIVDPTVTNNMFSKVNPLDAVAAAKGFYTFKDVVQASQR
ncbi:Peridinin-chlorophyll a-binding protein, chloroplastic [Symbiodinium microadriaticum]|uniref:Peridinin-chlorophyll a-binding protein, chloroplastic n=1 Tax=Symbiodinium microadriaticum TaxID=2951 RepID=A0A1Q9D5R1_SYMMI|nr:Peridinin-chlorophyll a-binding protein, chloroplastic [Symbiodinium microadriaticum]